MVGTIQKARQTVKAATAAFIHLQGFHAPGKGPRGADSPTPHARGSGGYYGYFMDPAGILWEDLGQSGTRPVRTPSDTASVRERTPSFSSTAARWYLTVCVVIRKSAAISLLLKPRATSRSTSSSRAVSAPPAWRAAPGAAVATTRSLTTTSASSAVPTSATSPSARSSAAIRRRVTALDRSRYTRSFITLSKAAVRNQAPEPRAPAQRRSLPPHR